MLLVVGSDGVVVDKQFVGPLLTELLGPQEAQQEGAVLRALESCR